MQKKEEKKRKEKEEKRKKVLKLEEAVKMFLARYQLIFRHLY